ncbi:26S proteasome non-ATPase regulatory subunit 7 homolog A isoform X1 [Salvia miltiorrhiza]|uniref:26S proteasome non-ATPase regulatory subunit 7 homolog A isoform X1 n=1 Tax=Salvia miltiorrhiza TaxID=226208 RepID=UPI0025AC1559|nr:26S proteasome non-ATPase regulatory subunit 7 homolog A isoform X1 [Salvia miltiorrhiza]
MDVIKSQQISARPIDKVVVHPLVLLSIVDHYNRVARDTRKRVVGVLLGSSYKGTVDVTNSYAVPFEEDDRDPSIWFLDHNYHESMFSMFRRINAKEHVVGWYSTGPKLKENDLNIHGLFNDYVPTPVLVIIDVQPKELGIPTKAYYAVEEVKENATQKSQKVFVHVPSEIAAHEVEEIGVEHLLRDVKDTTISTLATEVTGKLAALKGLDARLKEIRSYLDLVIEGKLPLNHEILYHLQDVFNLLPNLNVSELVKAFAVKTNDMMLVIYLSSLIRSVIALHNLINNKVRCSSHVLFYYDAVLTLLTMNRLSDFSELLNVYLTIVIFSVIAYRTKLKHVLRYYLEVNFLKIFRAHTSFRLCY